MLVQISVWGRQLFNLTLGRAGRGEERLHALFELTKGRCPLLQLLEPLLEGTSARGGRTGLCIELLESFANFNQPRALAGQLIQDRVEGAVLFACRVDESLESS